MGVVICTYTYINIYQKLLISSWLPEGKRLAPPSHKDRFLIRSSFRRCRAVCTYITIYTYIYIHRYIRTYLNIYIYL